MTLKLSPFSSDSTKNTLNEMASVFEYLNQFYSTQTVPSSVNSVLWEKLIRLP